MPRPPQKSGRPGLSMAGQTNKRPVLNLPRQAAVRILNGVMTEHKQLSELTQSDDFQALAPEDRARSQRLATHTLRHVGRADRALRPHLSQAASCRSAEHFASGFGRDRRARRSSPCCGQ